MSDDQRRSRTACPAARHRVSVLGSFTLTADGYTVPLGVDSRRLVAYLAIHPRPQDRVTLASDLWPGVAPAAAVRMLTEAVDAVGVPELFLADDADTAAEDAGAGSGGALALAAEVEVDLADALGLVRAIPEIPANDSPDIALLGADILPGWTAAWIVVERERFRQLRLHALEERSLRLTAAARYEAAVAMAQTAVKAAPSRESARRALIEAHLAQGNIAAAVAEYDDYQELLRSSVGPASSGLDALFPPSPVWPIMRARRPMPRSAVQLPGLRAARGAYSGGGRRLVTGGTNPGSSR